MPRRTPVQTIVLFAAIGIGLYLAVMVVGSWLRRTTGDQQRGMWPDVEVRDAAPAQLAQHRFRLTGREPQSWSDISLRLYQDARGALTALRCRIDAAEVDGLLNFPAGSVQPADDALPADWPKDGWGGGAGSDPFRLPAWFTPGSGRSRRYHAEANGTATGLWAQYDPASRWLHVWQWTRLPVEGAPKPASAPTTPDPLPAAAVAIEAAARSAGRAALAGRWQVVDDWTREQAQAPTLPPCARVRAAVAPWEGRYRLLLRLEGVDEAAARTFAGHLPLRALAGDAPPPAWAFAAPPPYGDSGRAPPVGAPAPGREADGVLPPWFSAGPGWRGWHRLQRLGDGAIASARWVAWDAGAQALLVWDWSDSVPRTGL